ncbi:Peptidase aspartic [Akanthomyces lecanii RCEF 1005]|uniref:Peptidase aspartic n=1 Tax=Akanthomyces lecanii RCEF 1005 TaxID=1081108 RepID=A0A168CQJ2_CORDF|nr:Peptidase aspartic [Akanthomyces lecanii RCEF 1005]
MRGSVTHTLIAALPLANAVMDGVFVLPLTRIKGHSAYGIQVDVGTPPQRNVMFIDTGSATTGVEDPNSRACKMGSCRDYGFYDNTTSSTSVWIDDEYSDQVGDHGYGSYINDTVTLGGHTVSDITFGTLSSFSGFDQSQPQAGIFGLGAVCRESDCRQYPTTLQQIADRGLISHRVLSMYLGPNVLNATGELLFGGVDRAKQDGVVHTLPMRPNLSGQPNNVQITAVTLRRADSSNVTANIPESQQMESVWDSGNPGWEIPEPVFEAALAALGNPDKKTLAYGYEVDCKYRAIESEDVLEVTFTDGVEVEISLDRVVGEYDGTRCITYLETGGTGAGSLGDEFLRNVYTTFDYDAKTISFSKVKYTAMTDIQTL